MHIGYARVSTDDQTNEAQYEALRRAGCDVIFEDTATGMSRRRPGLAKALRATKPGGKLVVWKLDRLGRSLRHLMDVAEGLRSRGVEFVSLTEQIDTTTSVGELFFHVLGAVAQFERTLIVERTRAGLAVARANGVRLGKPRSLSPAQSREVGALMDSGARADELARLYGVSGATIYRCRTRERTTAVPA